MFRGQGGDTPTRSGGLPVLTTATHARSSFDARMLAAADRLFDEFDALPVATVFRAIGDARRLLRERDGIAVPEEVEKSARCELARIATPTQR